MDEIQAAVLNIKLNYLDAENSKRRAIAYRYCSEINNPAITIPRIPADSKEHVWHLFVVRCEDRNRLQAFLLEKGIQTLIHYPIAPHKQKAYSAYNHLTFPLTEQLQDEVLSLPISQVMSDEDVNYIIQVCNKFS